ncbi:hypothetical protein [Spirillospora sp. NPDC048819]|uniref:tetratricopeptide repeat protein n=1 Tax=Spirillospora sp. NPDC048819 TaxID=3155268 RepID=UPI0033FF76D3
MQAMERAAADRAAWLAALLAEFSVLPPAQVRQAPFPTLSELTDNWDGKPEPAAGVYLPRPDVDEELCAALASPTGSYPFLLVYGDDGAGKSTSTWKAIETVLSPETKVLVPRDVESLVALATVDLASIAAQPALIWVDELTVDDLDSLTHGIVDRLTASAFIVATISASVVAAILAAPPDQWQVARSALRRAYLLHLLYDPVLVEQVKINSRGGVVPSDVDGLGDVADDDRDMLILRLNTASAANPAGMALVRAAIDCRRAGLERPVTDSELRRLFAHYLAEIRNIAVSEELFEAGIVWAQGTGSANEALLTVHPARGRDDERRWSVARVLVDDAEPNRVIPDALWAELIDFATPEQCAHIGRRARELQRLTYAATAHVKASTVSPLEARERILAALAYMELGDQRATRESLEAAYQAGVRDGLSSEACFAAYQLGDFSKKDGDTETAIRLWTFVAEQGQEWSLEAFLALGAHYTLSGETEKALVALDRDFSDANLSTTQRRATMLRLALRPTQEGLAEIVGDQYGSVEESDEDRQFKRVLIDHVAQRLRDSDTAVDNRAEALFEQGRTALLFGSKEDAATFFERCIECADADHSVEAAFALGELRHEEGDAAGAERAWRAVLDLAEPAMVMRARFNIGLLRMEAGDEAAAVAMLETVLTKGDAARRAHAALLMAQIRKSQGADVPIVDDLYQQAIEADDPEWSPLALTELGLRKYGRDGATDEAVSLLSRAAESRQHEARAKAPWVLGRLLEDREDLNGAIQAYEASIAAEHPEFTPAAHISLGQLYGTLNRVQLGMRHLKTAYNSGHPEYRLEAAFWIGLYHYWFGRFRNAAAVFREVVNGRHPRLWPEAGVLLGRMCMELGDARGAAKAWRAVARSGSQPSAREAMANLLELSEGPLGEEEELTALGEGNFEEG